MPFLLDTNTISDLMYEEAGTVTQLAAVSPSERIITCVIVRGEILHGIERIAPGRRQRDLRAKANALFEVVPCEAVPFAAAEHYARVKSVQQARGLSLDENDLWIAATAFAYSCTLVTRDADFSRIDNLSVIDWTRK